MKDKDLQPERWNRLRELLKHKGVVHLDELCEKLNVSPATVRRDLRQLEDLGKLRRVHGGAVSTGPRLEELLFDEKARIAVRAKRRIAHAAVKFVGTGDTVYLDGGSTVVELARLLRERNDITIVTNSLRAALELAGGGPRLILIGGELRRRSQTIVGSLTSLMLSELHVDKAFIGTLGLTMKEGLTTSDPDEAYTKVQVMERAGEVILLADSSKAGKILLSNAGKIEDVNVLVTDKDIDPKIVQDVHERGIQVIRT